MGKQWKQCQTLFFWAPKSLQMVITAVKLKDAYWELDTTERLQFHFSLSCIGEGNGNPLQCSCLKKPRDREPGGLLSMGSHRVRHDWRNLAPAPAYCTALPFLWGRRIILVPAPVSDRVSFLPQKLAFTFHFYKQRPMARMPNSLSRSRKTLLNNVKTRKKNLLEKTTKTKTYSLKLKLNQKILNMSIYHCC